jgi:hypothetical protein
MRDVKRIIGLLSLFCTVIMAIGWSMAGCAEAKDILPAALENRIASDANADDHLEAAMLYYQEAQRLQAQAEKYEREAASIKPLEDPKGIRRNGLRLAAQRTRREASELQQLYAAHQAKAQTLTGKRQPD